MPRAGRLSGGIALAVALCFGQAGCSERNPDKPAVQPDAGSPGAPGSAATEKVEFAFLEKKVGDLQAAIERWKAATAKGDANRVGSTSNEFFEAKSNLEAVLHPILKRKPLFTDAVLERDFKPKIEDPYIACLLEGPVNR